MLIVLSFKDQESLPEKLEKLPELREKVQKAEVLETKIQDAKDKLAKENQEAEKRFKVW